jgi:predicted esterase
MSNSPDDIRIRTRATVRTARYAVLGTEPAEAQRVWFVLHGYGQLAPRFLRHFAGAVPSDTCIIAPEGLSRFYVEMPRTDGAHLQRVGATWMTREAREDDIADTMRWLDLLSTEIMAAVGNVPVGVLAFSQGVATATRWLAHSGLQPDAFVAWAGGVAHDVDEQRMRDVLHNTAVTLVAGTEDGFVPPETRAAMLATLQQWQPGAQTVAFAGGHHLDRAVLAEQLAALTARRLRASE